MPNRTRTIQAILIALVVIEIAVLARIVSREPGEDIFPASIPGTCQKGFACTNSK